MHTADVDAKYTSTVCTFGLVGAHSI